MNAAMIEDYRLARHAQVQRAEAVGATPGTPEWDAYFGLGEYRGQVPAERPILLKDFMIAYARERQTERDIYASAA